MGSSNLTDLSVAIEETPGVLPVTPEWDRVVLTGYNAFGSNIGQFVPTPLGGGRQPQEGDINTVAVAAGFVADYQQRILRPFIPMFLYGARKELPTFAVTDVQANALVGSGFTPLTPGCIIGVRDAVNLTNNRNVVVDTVTDDNNIVLRAGTDLLPETTVMDVVLAGFEYGDLAATLTGYTGTGIEGAVAGYQLEPGDWVYVGGDAVGSNFATVANNGVKRILSLSAGVWTIDRTDVANAVEADPGAVQVFFAEATETSDTIEEITASLERRLTTNQFQTIASCKPNTLAIDMTTEDRIVFTMDFIGRSEVFAVAAAAGTRNARPSDKVFGTTATQKRMRLTDVNSGAVVAPQKFTDYSLNVNNNVSSEAAMGCIGPYRTPVGDLVAETSVTGFFEDTAILQAVLDSTLVSLDTFYVNSQRKGLVIDQGQGLLATEGLTIERNSSIRVPLTLTASQNQFGSTVSIYEFPSLPAVAAAVVT